MMSAEANIAVLILYWLAMLLLQLPILAIGKDQMEIEAEILRMRVDLELQEYARLREDT